MAQNCDKYLSLCIRITVALLKLSNCKQAVENVNWEAHYLTAGGLEATPVDIQSHLKTSSISVYSFNYLDTCPNVIDDQQELLLNFQQPSNVQLGNVSFASKLRQIKLRK